MRRILNSIWQTPSLIMVCFYMGCSPMEDPIPNYATCDFVVPECDPESFMPDPGNIDSIIESTCTEDLGTISLLGDSKKFFWFFCSSIDSLKYEDSLGNSIELHITSRTHKMVNAYGYSFSEPGCPTFIYASLQEMMEIILINEQINIKFKLVLEPGGTKPDNYDGLDVNKTTYDDIRPYWSNTVLFMALNNRNPNLTIVTYRHNTHLIIHGKSYDDVYWNDGRYDVPMEIYYNQECGLIAFRDDSGTFWKLAGIN